MKFKLKEALKIDIKELANYLPELNYRKATTSLFSPSECIVDGDRVALLFTGTPENGFSEIHTNYTEVEFVALLNKLPRSPELLKLRNALTEAGLPLIPIEDPRKAHIFSNDSHTDRGIVALRKEKPWLSDSKKHVAIIIGTGNAISYFHPMLEKGITKVYFLDISQFTLAWIKQSLSLLGNSENRAAFKNAFFDEKQNPLLAELIKYHLTDGIDKTEVVRRLKARFEDEKGEASVQHFCSKEDLFIAARGTLKELEFDFRYVNLFDEGEISSLETHLRENNEIVCVANFTNVAMWAKKEGIFTSFADNLNKLPWHPERNFIISVIGEDFNTVTDANVQLFIERAGVGSYKPQL